MMGIVVLYKLSFLCSPPCRPPGLWVTPLSVKEHYACTPAFSLDFRSAYALVFYVLPNHRKV